ncbi:hypothetical protein CWI39_1569p0020 [Hamiltosporidium magnivora]|uniref:TFIIS N-terminal domain-containing protein n=1 Tax=Hamiltosporidium magnivora TaxID=148818 RepID=A0A4Q9L0G6_9MICR|nr:hypothetical protein CWI39_1569p0020 [Hamiltosporidium magnivora]
MHDQIKEEIEKSEENLNICKKNKKEKSFDISSDEMDSLEKLKKDMEVIGNNNNINSTSNDEESNEEYCEESNKEYCEEFNKESNKEYCEESNKEYCEEFNKDSNKEYSDSKIENNNEFNDISFDKQTIENTDEIFDESKIKNNFSKITETKIDSIETENKKEEIFSSLENIKNNQIQTEISFFKKSETKKTKNKSKLNINKEMLDNQSETTIKEKRIKKRIESEKEDKIFKKTKKNEISEEEINNFVNKFKKEMLNAVNKDNQSNKEKKPSFEKVNMVDSVSKALLNKKYQTSFLDSDVLSVIRMWLEPLPDKTLPGYKIKSTLLELLLVVPVKKYHLIESKVGRIVFFYSKNERENKEIKRMAKKLVYLWTQVALKD